MKWTTLFASCLFLFSLVCEAESLQSREMRRLINDEKMTDYISEMEKENNVKLTGINIVQEASDDVIRVWELNFEGGVNPKFAKILCKGLAISSRSATSFTRAHCEIVRFTD